MDLNLGSEFTLRAVVWMPVATAIAVFVVTWLVHRSRTRDLREKLEVLDKEIRKERERLWVADRELEAERSQHRPLAEAQQHLYDLLPMQFRELSAATDRTDLAELLARSIQRAFGPRQWLIFESVDRECTEFVLVDGSAEAEGGWPAGARLNLQMGRLGLAARRGKVMDRTDFEAEPPTVREHLATTEPRGFQADVVAPIVLSGQTVMLISVGEPGPPLGASRTGLELLAEFAGSILRSFDSRERAQRLENLDRLTGLFNRSFLTAQGAEVLYEARLDRQPLAVVICSIDDYAEFLAVEGHDTADRLLRCLSELMTGTFRDEDLLARWDMDRFVAVMPGATADIACQRAEQMRRVVEDPNWPYGETSIRVSVNMSAGVAAFPEDGEKLSELVDTAAKNLAGARWAGGNQVCEQLVPGQPDPQLYPTPGM